MNNILDKQLIIHSDCKLTSVCHTNLNSINPDILDKYVSVEFLKYKDRCLYDSCIIKTSQIDSPSEFALLNDGIYEYNCYLIPTLEYLLIDTDKYDVEGNMLYNEICLEDSYFYYNGYLYYINYVGNDYNIDTYLSATNFINTYKDTILSLATKISLDYLSSNTEIGNQTYFCKKIAFTYCNLIKCFVSLQSNLANSLCDASCEKTDVYNRDFLLSTIYVLDYLRDTNNFKEAQRILDNINECGGFCKSETLTKCNCCG